MGSLTICNPTVSGRLGASAIGRTYYVSPTGNDSNDGRTTASAWQTIARVNSGTYYPGDRILFQGGQTFTSSVGLLLNTTNCPANGGAAANPLTIGSYGKGKATINITVLSQHGIRSLNLAWIQISNLILIGSSTGTQADYHGILFENTTGSLLDGCQAVNCDVSYFPNTGIYALGGSAANSGFTNLYIYNCNAANCVNYGIASGVPGTFTINDNTGGFSYPATNRSHSNIFVGQCRASRIIGDASYRYLCGSGIMIANCTNPLIEYCLADNCGGGGNNGGGPVGIWFWNCSYGLMQYCESYGTKANNTNQDGGAFDIDINCDHCVIQYCYGHDCEGYGVLMYLTLGNNAFRFNTLINNASRNTGELTIYQPPDQVGTDYVYNNSVLGTTAVYCLNNGTPGQVQTIFQNNELVVKSGGTLINKTNASTTVLFQNNGYWELNNTFKVVDGGTTYNTLSDWKTARSQESTTNGANGGYFGDPRLVNDFAANAVAPSYPAYGVANRKLKNYAVSNLAPASLIAMNLAVDMGGKDFNGNTFTQPFTNKAVGAIATDLSPLLLLTGTTTGTAGASATYTISIVRPVSGSTVVFTPTATGLGVITPTTITLNSGNSYSATFTVQWASAGTYSVSGSASGFTNPTAIAVTVSNSGNDPTTVQNYIASQLPQIPSAQRSSVATAMISSVSGQSYVATDIVDAIASSVHWTSADPAMCYALSTDTAPNVSLTGAVGKLKPYKGTQNWTSDDGTGRPIITTDGLLFDGVANFLSADYSFGDPDPACIFIVLKRLGRTNPFATPLGGDHTYNLCVFTDSTDTLVYLTAAESGADHQISLPITNIQAPTLIGFVANGANSVGYNGLTPLAQPLQAASTTKQFMGTQGIGRFSDSWFNGNIQDVIVNTDPTKALMLLRFLKAYRGL